MKSKIKQLANLANRKATAALVAVSAFAATNAYAGPVAEAVKTEAAGGKEDLAAVGAVVIGFVVIVTIFGAAIRLFRRAG